MSRSSRHQRSCLRGTRLRRKRLPRPSCNCTSTICGSGRVGCWSSPGWCVCLGPLKSVEVLVDEQLVGSAETGRLRDDVAAAHPEYENARSSGFAFRTNVSALGSGRRTVTVRSTSSGGISRSRNMDLEFPELEGARADSRDDGTRLHCDSVELRADGWLAVKGWAICQSAPARGGCFLRRRRGRQSGSERRTARRR